MYTVVYQQNINKFDIFQNANFQPLHYTKLSRKPTKINLFEIFWHVSSDSSKHLTMMR